MAVALERREVQAADGSVRFTILNTGDNPVDSEGVDTVRDIGVPMTTHP